MKNTFFFLVLIISTYLNAQITKSNWLVGGDISFSYSESKSDIGSQTFNLTASPNIGYFFFNNLAIGTKINFTTSKSKFKEGNSTFERLLISPFARYYFLNVDKPTNIFVESAYRYALLNENNFTDFSLKFGTSIFLNSTVAFEVGIEYLNSKTKNQFIGSHRLLLGFGIQVHLEKL